MAIDVQLLAEVTEFLYEEAACLDQRRWDDWLALYEEDCVYWVPAWHDDESYTQDPDTQLSLIYLQGKERLGERIWRIRSGLSSSLLRMPRVTHLVSTVRLAGERDGCLLVTANFHADAFKLDEKRADYFFGSYHYALRRRADGFGIVQKKIIVNNDVIPRQLDVFSV
jgi:3-phenylpropionate/cinnamic acid dioxygenase small subunit